MDDDDDIQMYVSQRKWIGLTDEEIEYLWGITPEDFVDKFALPRAIEALLKEKNGGAI